MAARATRPTAAAYHKLDEEAKGLRAQVRELTTQVAESNSRVEALKSKLVAAHDAVEAASARANTAEEQALVKAAAALTEEVTKDGAIPPTVPRDLYPAIPPDERTGLAVYKTFANLKDAEAAKAARPNHWFDTPDGAAAEWKRMQERPLDDGDTPSDPPAGDQPAA